MLLLTVLFGVLGIVALVWLALLLLAYESVKRPHLWFPKFFVVVARVGCGLGGFFSGARGHWPSDNLPPGTTWGKDFFNDSWNWTMVSAVVAWVLWKTVQIVGEWRRTQLSEATRALERQVLLRTALLTSLRRSVNEKKSRIADGIGVQTTEPPPLRCPGACALLRPPHQIRILLEHFALCLKTLHPKPDSPDAARQNFRLCLYVDKGEGVLQPWVWFDMNDVGADVSSFRPEPATDKRDRFNLKNKRNPAVAVQSVQRGRLLIVPNCKSPPGGINFAYFDTNQERLLESLFSYPIPQFRTKEGGPRTAALVVSTNIPDYFREADRLVLEMFGEEFSSRLNLEAHVLALIERN